MSKNDNQDHKKELIIITEPAVNGVVPEVQDGDIVFITKSRNYVHSDYMNADEDKTIDSQETTDLSANGLNKMVEKLTVSEPNEKIKTLKSWLNKTMKILMTDGRLLVGNFLCTDRDANVILGSCTEHINYEACGFSEEPRMLGLVMVPGRHIVSIHLDVTNSSTEKPKQSHSVTEEVMYFYRNGETDEKATKDDMVEN